jgi:hypothetical protein
MKKIFLAILALGLCVAASVSLGAGQMPGTVVLGGISDKYEPVTFDHAMHLNFMESCGQCHHQHPRASSLTCQGCHSIEKKVYRDSAAVSSFISCQSCHGQYDPGSPNMPGLKAAYHRTCFECHRGMGQLGQGPEGCTQQCHDRRAAK